MPAFGPRKGQWVTTSLEIPGAHTTPDGRPIGIYHPAGRAQVPKVVGKTKKDEGEATAASEPEAAQESGEFGDPTSLGSHSESSESSVSSNSPSISSASPVSPPEFIATPPTVTFIAPDGQDLVILIDRQARSFVCHPDDLPDLQPLIEADYLPESRGGHLAKGHKLPA